MKSYYCLNTTSSHFHLLANALSFSFIHIRTHVSSGEGRRSSS